MDNNINDTNEKMEKLKELIDRLVQSGVATQEEINILTNVMYNASLSYALEGIMLFHPDKLNFRSKIEMLVNEGMNGLNDEEFKLLEKFVEGQIQYRVKAMSENEETSPLNISN